MIRCNERLKSLLAQALIVLAGLVCTQTAALAQAGTSRFDGAWEVTIDCPDHDEDIGVKGYLQQFPGEIRNGQFRAVHGTEGQPGWHLVQGVIAEDGTSTLKLDGIVKSTNHSVNRPPKGKPYSYRIKAQFEPTSGTGQRIGKRKCDYTFKRR